MYYTLTSDAPENPYAEINIGPQPMNKLTSDAPVKQIPVEILYHKDGGNLNNGIGIFATDNPGPGGARHHYSFVFHSEKGYLMYQNIAFQKGVVTENGINGISQEALLAVLIHRLECFIAGPYPSIETQNALNHCKMALDALKARTQDRLNRGVLGKYEK